LYGQGDLDARISIVKRNYTEDGQHRFRSAGYNIKNNTDFHLTGDGITPPILGVPDVALNITSSGGLYAGIFRNNFGPALTPSASLDYFDTLASFGNSSYLLDGNAYVWYANHASHTGIQGLNLMIRYYASGTAEYAAGTAKVKSFDIINDSMAAQPVTVVGWALPLTGPAASPGWYSNVVPIETTRTDKWYLMACENATHNVHIYELNRPGELYVWS
jgi:hypothetical protein